MGNDEIMEYFVWLQLCLGAGNKRINKILERFAPSEIYNLTDKQLSEIKIFTAKEKENFKTITLKNAQDIIEKCRRNGIKIITLGSDSYPLPLAEIYNPPLVLYVKGNLPDFENIPTVCIVGPRKVSEFGKKSAYSLGYRLAKSGMIVVSGGAVGADTYAHIGALKANGKTVLVMGCGILASYLEENRALREHISKFGCLISEYPPDFSASKSTFPIRNRIMSGLSLGTVLVEAGLRSGALITANHALEQDRDVFVIPGRPDLAEYKGSNKLFRDGAKPLLDTSDIFNEYIPLFPDKIDVEKAYKKEPKPEKNKNNKKILNETLSNQAKIVYNCLNSQKFYPDELNTGLDSTQLLSALTELEMEFIIRALPGGQYEICK